MLPKTCFLHLRWISFFSQVTLDVTMNLYGAGFSQGYDNTIYAKNLLAMAKTLGYPESATLDDINDVLKYLREALKINC